MITAIVYTSNSGYTAQYAEILHQKTKLPAYTLDQAKAALPEQKLDYQTLMVIKKLI